MTKKIVVRRVSAAQAEKIRQSMLGKNTKSVQRLSIRTGRVMATYGSQREAAKAVGCCEVGICLAVKNKSIAKGWRWRRTKG